MTWALILGLLAACPPKHGTSSIDSTAAAPPTDPTASETTKSVDPWQVTCPEGAILKDQPSPYAGYFDRWCELDGLRHGRRIFVEDNVLTVDEQYLNGVPRITRIYYPNGAPVAESFLNEQSQQVGVWRRWNQEGQLIKEAHWQNGSLLEAESRCFTDNGQPTSCVKPVEVDHGGKIPIFPEQLQCTAHSDCVIVDAIHGCGCGGGGSATTINRFNAPNLRRKIKETYPDTVCPAVESGHATCVYAYPVCMGGQCRIVQKEYW
jgi:hypothetical protein